MLVKKKGKKTSFASDTLKLLLDPELDSSDKKLLFAQMARDDSAEAWEVLQLLISMASEDDNRQDYRKRKKQLDNLMEMLEAGPWRLGVYLCRSPGTDGQVAHRTHVLMENGDTTFPVVSDPVLAETLVCGDTVVLDAQARAVMARGPVDSLTGEVGQLKQRIGATRVRVALNDLSSEAYRMSHALKAQIDSGEVQMGAELLVCTRRRMAFEALPKEVGVSHYKFLETGPVPKVDVRTDIGRPHSFIEELDEHIRDEMTNPELGRKYGIRRMQTRLLKGLTGSGKTFSILGLINLTYHTMSELTGAPIDALPNRVLRMRMAQVLDKYVGESDKRLDRFFDELVQLGSETFTWEGRTWKLPVIARCEEIDALARARDGSEDVMGRIQTTMLERLDHLSDEIGDTLCILIFTTNVSEICDQAFIRRAGGQIIDFGRIGRAQFRSILAKKIRELPMHPELGNDQQQAERRLAHEVTDWMFSPNGHDRGQVEVTFAGSATKEIKYRRDVLTGSVVDLSVQQASAEAKRVEKQGLQAPGLTTELVLTAFDRQIRGMCEQITEFNAHKYLPLPEGARVASVRRIEQPTVQAYDLERRDQ